MSCCYCGAEERTLQYEANHSGASYDDIQRHLFASWGIRLGTSTIGDIWRQRSKWIAKDDADKSQRAVVKHSDLEDALSLWFHRVHVNGIEVSDFMMKEQAKIFGEKLGTTGFSYSQGWQHCFKKRDGISSHKLQEESGSTDMDVVDKGRTEALIWMLWIRGGQKP